MDLLAIDPGNATGWAHFKGYQLVACGLLGPDSYAELPACPNVIVEEPQVYRHGRADPNKLLVLAEKVGHILQLFPHARKVTPHAWKGDLPKTVCHVRWLPKLCGGERNVLEAGTVQLARSLRHNVFDAVCLGLWELKR